MQKTGDCEWTGTIPAEAVKGATLRYYVVAKTQDGRPAAAKGNPRTPFVMAVALTEESPPEAPPRDEVPENLFGNQNKPGKSGCAGCRAQGGGPGLPGLLLFALVALALVLMGRRR
jgi:MYXO-CTERM domain-containing protein